MEVPLEQNALVMKNAKDKGAKVIMNLAPALSVSKALLSLVDYLIVNQIEARQLAEKLKINIEDDTTKLAKALAQEGRLTCIVTLGPEGIVAVEPNGAGLKIPSMKIIDIAKAISPDSEIVDIGIRPGEKLHEEMISLQDSDFTFEYDNYYKILPMINNWYKDRDRIGDGIAVGKSFSYTSDNNKDWMTKAQLIAWVNAESDNSL